MLDFYYVTVVKYVWAYLVRRPIVSADYRPSEAAINWSRTPKVIKKPYLFHIIRIYLRYITVSFPSVPRSFEYSPKFSDNNALRISAMCPFHRPLLWSSSLATDPEPGFDSQRYQIFWEVVGLERGALSLVSTMRSYLKEKIEAPV
jgi:hypothetical protein